IPPCFLPFRDYYTNDVRTGFRYFASALALRLIAALGSRIDCYDSAREHLGIDRFALLGPSLKRFVLDARNDASTASRSDAKKSNRNQGNLDRRAGIGGIVAKIDFEPTKNRPML